MKGPKLPRELVEPPALKILEALRPHYKRIELGGSLRRGCSTASDIDFLATGPEDGFDPEPVLASLFPTKFVPDGVGPRKCWEIDPGVVPIHVDIWTMPEENWGAAHMYITGPGRMNVFMRRWAIWHGFTLNLWGVYLDGKLIASRTEEECFDALGWRFIPPEGRNFIENYDVYIDYLNAEQEAERNSSTPSAV